MSFQQSSNKIYNTSTLHGQLKKWTDTDVYRILSPLTSRGYFWCPESHSMRRSSDRAMSAETPWIHAMGSYHKQCLFDHHVVFDMFNIIPPKCQECWKTVATPNTFKQLLEIEDIQIQMKVPCKCGIELRDYTPKHYGSYWYSNSLDEGRERYKQVRQIVDEHVTDGKSMDVLLKRGCTEFEMIKGPSPFWHMTPQEEEMYELVSGYVDTGKVNALQPEMIKNHVRTTWALWAHSHGDFTYKDWNDGESLFPGYVKYHEGDLDDIKADLAIARAGVLAGITEEQTRGFLEVAQKYAKEKKIPVGKFVHALGANERNPLQLNMFKKFSDEVIGEEDELT